MKKLAVILAGGLSSRMGREKSLLEIDNNKFLIDKVIESIAPQVERIAINANHKANHDAARFAHTNLAIIHDEVVVAESVGPLIGILTAMAWARENGGDVVLTVSCDCPQLPNDLYKKLAAQQNYDVVVAKSFGHNHPTIALWRVDLARDLRAAIKNNMRKIDKFTSGYRVATVDFTPPQQTTTTGDINLTDPFLNLNTPDEFAAWQRAQKK
ncbi:MAG: molybdenum cofactor guanylyltransferase MobA [Hydrotalea sp.]|nr:molybdenum cofactor guanylyltransferase MobA [Hydrotalea sp.]